MNCPSCASECKESFRFCPSCGGPLFREAKGRRFGIVEGGAVIGIALVIWGFGWYASSVTVGSKPTMTHDQVASEREDESDPVIEKLRAEVEKNPSIEGLRKLSEALWSKLADSANPSRQTTLDLLDTLSAILQAAPEDPQSLLMMANLTFSEKVFPKSLEYFERYLKVSPTDIEARASYASVLTFLGKLNEAEHELKTVLTKNPKYFKGLAYLAITYAEMGKVDEASKYGKEAMKLSPDPEASRRLSEFLKTIEKKSNGTSTDQIGDIIKGNPIAGPKFVKAEDGGSGVVRVFMREFPMSAMPPFAKEKFFSDIRAKVKEANLHGVTKIEFLDADSGAVMESIQRE